MPLAAKNADLRAYLQSASNEENPQAVLTYLARGARYVSQAPDAAGPAQREQFKLEVEILLELVKNESGGALRPVSWQPA